MRTLLAMSCVGFLVGCGGSYGGGDGTAQATVNMAVNPPTITLGQSATITWSSNAGACLASGEWSGNKPATGSESVTPARTGPLTYSLICQGGGYRESETLSATLTVNPTTGFTPTVIVSKFAGGAARAIDPGLIAPSGIAAGGGTLHVATRTSASRTGPIAVAFGRDGSVITSDVLSAADGAMHTGLALVTDTGGAARLYAADFRNGKIDVFDASLERVARSQARFAFDDPKLPAGYAPFGIQAFRGASDGATQLFVTYAWQPSADVTGPANGAGLGLVNVFDADGRLLRRLVPAGGALDAPWGLALAPSGFGSFEGALLVGNSGDGRIHAFDSTSGALLGALSDADGRPLTLRGLWGIASGEGTVFFAASTDEADGVVGRIDPDR
jgi:uncharacterized protein (TIGR03118 family)